MHIQQKFALFLQSTGTLGNLVLRGCTWEKYHGFSKYSVPELVPLAKDFGFLTPENMLLEMVEISEYVPGGCHVHHETTAVVLFLGREDGVDPPHYLSQYYLKYPGEERGEWYPALPSTCVLIPPGTVHDFYPGKGKMYFLSVQDPKLFDPETGKDDFHHTSCDVPVLTRVGFLRKLSFFLENNRDLIVGAFAARCAM